ncbi:MAG: hypothetical protein ACXVX1_09755 [Mycobacterium sp.]
MTDPTARIDQYAEATRDVVGQAGEILLQANDQMKDGTFNSAQWAKSAYQLVNLFLTAGLEAGAQALCPQRWFGEPELSDFITVTPDNTCERMLSLAQPFVHDGAPGCRIPDQFVVFVPKILPVYAKQFRVGVNWPDLRSGTYRGRVRLTSLKAAVTQAVETDVTVDL